MTKKNQYLSNTIIFILTALTLVLVWSGSNILIGIIACAGVAVLAKVLLDNFLVDENKPQVPKLTRQKENFYKSKGLSSEDITFFRETMSTAKSQILNIESGFAKSSKLQAIERRNNTVEIAKSLFNDIVKEPDRLHQVNQYLYVHLPSLNDLIQKHNAIDAHKAKSKATYDILSKSADTIDELSQEITNDYLAFKDSDLSSLDMTLDVTKRTMNQDFENQDIWDC